MNLKFRDFFNLFVGFFFINKLFYFDEEFIISISFFIIFFNLFFLLSDMLKAYLDKRSVTILNGFLDYYSMYIEYISYLKKFHKIRTRKEFVLTLINFFIGFLNFYKQLVLDLYNNIRNLKLDELFANILLKSYKDDLNLFKNEYLNVLDNGFNEDESDNDLNLKEEDLKVDSILLDEEGLENSLADKVFNIDKYVK